jgi:multiple sugar transport system permease protein
MDALRSTGGPRTGSGTGLVASGRGGSGGYGLRRRRFHLCMLAPTAIVLFAVTIVPTLYLIGTSFTSLTLSRPGSLALIGLGNYTKMLHDERFLNSLVVQARLSTASVALQVILGLGIALLLQGRYRYRQVTRGLFIIPMVLPPVVVAIVWKILLSPDISVINWALASLGLPAEAWLANPSTALWGIVLADTWEWFPFVTLILLAALESLPVEPVEAARIDGASEAQVLRHVVLPLIRPAIVVAGLFRFIDSIKAFPLIFVMTGGGPGNVTEATNYYAYVQAFAFSEIGYSSAIVVVLIVIAFTLSLLLVKLNRPGAANA